MTEAEAKRAAAAWNRHDPKHRYHAHDNDDERGWYVCWWDAGLGTWWQQVPAYPPAARKKAN